MKKANKRWRSLLSVLLTVMLLVQMLPAQAFAVNSTESTSTEASAPVAEDAIILGEIVAEREAYVKRFKMSDGTIQAVQYDIPVHYQTEAGSWVDYDKTLTEADALEEDTLLAEETVVETDTLEQTEQGTDLSEANDPLSEEETQSVEEDSVTAEEPADAVIEPVAEEETIPEEDQSGETGEEEMTAENETAADPVETITPEPEAPAATPAAEETGEDTAAMTEEPAAEDEVAVVTDEIETVSTETEEVTTKEWVNLSPDFAVRFSKKTNGKKFVRVEVDGHALAWSYPDANKVEGVVVAPETSDDPLVLTNVRSSVVYPGAFDHADLEYLLQPGSLKENIVLQNANAASIYTIEYKYNSLTAVQVDEHTVEFQDDDGSAVYVLYAPYMTDAKGGTSTALTLEITKNKKNSCTIEMAADKDWLQDEARVYPVTLDPLMMTGQAWADTDACQSALSLLCIPASAMARVAQLMKARFMWAITKVMA